MVGDRRISNEVDETNSMKLEKVDREVTKLYHNIHLITPLAVELSEQVHPVYKSSVINLLRYLTFRKHDLRPIQSALTEYGISALRSGEGYILRNVVDVLKLIKLLRKMDWKPDPDLRMIGYEKSREHRKFTRCNSGGDLRVHRFGY